MSDIWHPCSIYSNMSNMTAYKEVTDNWHPYPALDGSQTSFFVFFFSLNSAPQCLNAAVLVCHSVAFCSRLGHSLVHTKHRWDLPWKVQKWHSHTSVSFDSELRGWRTDEFLQMQINAVLSAVLNMALGRRTGWLPFFKTRLIKKLGWPWISTNWLSGTADMQSKITAGGSMRAPAEGVENHRLCFALAVR